MQHVIILVHKWSALKLEMLSPLFHIAPIQIYSQNGDLTAKICGLCLIFKYILMKFDTYYYFGIGMNPNKMSHDRPYFHVAPIQIYSQNWDYPLNYVGKDAFLKISWWKLAFAIILVHIWSLSKLDRIGPLIHIAPIVV